MAITVVSQTIANCYFGFPHSYYLRELLLLRLLRLLLLWRIVHGRRGSRQDDRGRRHGTEESGANGRRSTVGGAFEGGRRDGKEPRRRQRRLHERRGGGKGGRHGRLRSTTRDHASWTRRSKNRNRRRRHVKRPDVDIRND